VAPWRSTEAIFTLDEVVGMTTVQLRSSMRHTRASAAPKFPDDALTISVFGMLRTRL
jgi:hypothetical protein